MNLERGSIATRQSTFEVDLAWTQPIEATARPGPANPDEVLTAIDSQPALRLGVDIEVS
jgi:hypothetical protein